METDSDNDIFEDAVESVNSSNKCEELEENLIHTEKYHAYNVTDISIPNKESSNKCVPSGDTVIKNTNKSAILSERDGEEQLDPDILHTSGGNETTKDHGGGRWKETFDPDFNTTLDQMSKSLMNVKTDKDVLSVPQEKEDHKQMKLLSDVSCDKVKGEQIETESETDSAEEDLMALKSSISKHTNEVHETEGSEPTDGNDLWKDDIENEIKQEDKKHSSDNGIIIDEEVMRKQEENMTDDEKEAKKNEAQELKTQGNEQFIEKDYRSACQSYSSALLTCPLCYIKERSIMYSNRAACSYKEENFEMSISDCSKALELNPNYLKALLRRAESYEKTDKLEDALTDYQKALEMDPSLINAREACMRLPDQIKERNEKMKEEMLGKLKDLGNMILRPFGLSTNNFQLQQDPNTGSYSVNFQQGQPNSGGGNNKK